MRAVWHILLGGFGAAAITAAAGAQEHTVVFDDTPGFGASGDAYRIPDDDGAGLDYRIDFCPSCSAAELPGGSHGQRLGTGLFQSLLRLDVNDGDTATFAASEFLPGDVDMFIENVFARVTGAGARSMIDGRIRSEVGSADLYLLNPHGVIFGQNASLDVGGSFHVSTADALRFDNGQDFESRPGGAVPMAIAPAVAFGFLDDGSVPETIRFDGTTRDAFAAPAGETFSAVGGRIELDGRGTNAEVPTLGSVGGVIQLAAVPAGSEVPTDLTSFGTDGLASTDAAIHFTDNAIVEVSGNGPAGAARVIIRGGRFEMASQAGERSGRVTAIGTGALPGDPPGVDLDVAGTLLVDNGTINGVSQSPALGGASGDIDLAGGSVSLVNGAGVTSEIAPGFHSVDGPDIRVEAGDLTVASGSHITGFNAGSLGTNTGNVGDIWVHADSILVTGESSEISAVIRGSGDGSILHVDSATSLALEDGGEIRFERVAGIIPAGTPDTPSHIEVLAGTLNVTGGSEILSNTATAFDGASVHIGSEAAPVQAVTVTAGTIGSVTTGGGAGGDVMVHAGQITLASDPDIPDSTGKINAVTQGSGPGGTLDVYADSIDLFDGGQMSTSTEAGAGPAGDLSVDVTGRLFASGTTTVGATPVSSGLFSRGADADGGDLSIVADRIDLERGADISTSALGDGKPGNLRLTARAISVTGGADSPTSIAAKSDDSDPGPPQGAGGDLTIDSDTLAITAGGEVTTSTTGTRDAGNLLVTAREILVEGTDALGFNRSGITSRSLQNSTGQAGSVTLRPPDGERLTLRIRDQGRASVESKGVGAAGDLLITGADLFDLSAGGEISATVGDVFTDDPGGPAAVASDIRVRDTGRVRVDGGMITAATSGSGVGGIIDIQAESIVLAQGAQVTSESTAEDGGAAGSIIIAALGELKVRKSEITTTAADAGGGRISMQAAGRLFLLDSTIETTVQGANDVAGEDAGDIDIPLRGDEVAGLEPGRPDFVVINGSIIRANAKATDAGNITIAAGDVLLSNDSLIEATSERGVSGEIEITAPDADVVGRVTALPSSFVDPSDRLLPPCVARTERTGSFVVQGREVIQPSPDAPLSPHLGSAGGASPARDPVECQVFEESS
ncbi:MAG: filamentous hemagglutinin N-terminal domain-containing protein [Myxococcota bacterium]